MLGVREQHRTGSQVPSEGPCGGTQKVPALERGGVVASSTGSWWFCLQHLGKRVSVACKLPLLLAGFSAAEFPEAPAPDQLNCLCALQLLQKWEQLRAEPPRGFTAPCFPLGNVSAALRRLLPPPSTPHLSRSPEQQHQSKGGGGCCPSREPGSCGGQQGFQGLPAQLHSVSLWAQVRRKQTGRRW